MTAESEDQAAGLRRQAPSRTVLPRGLRLMAVSSGKGGVGKTMTAIGLAYALARAHYRTLLMDGDIGMANVDIQLGINPAVTLQDVVFGGSSLAQATVTVEKGLDVLPSPCGAPEMADMGSARRGLFVDQLTAFAAEYDYMIIDVGAGIGQNVTAFLAAVPETLVVVANEPTSIMDAYSVIKVLRRLPEPPQMALVVNMVQTLNEGEALAGRLNGIVKRFLGAELPLAGTIVFDEKARAAIRARIPIMNYAPQSPAALCLAELGRYVARHKPGGADRKRIDARSFESLADMELRKFKGRDA
jgi:flagellar biosynthesis protein FlhG